MFDKKNKFMVFMKKQGFYIVLVLCILAVGGVDVYKRQPCGRRNDGGHVERLQRMHRKSGYGRDK